MLLFKIKFKTLIYVTNILNNVTYGNRMLRIFLFFKEFILKFEYNSEDTSH